MGKHRKRNIRRAYLSTAVAAALVLLAGAGYAMAEQPPAPVKVALSAPVIGERVTPPAPAPLVPEPSERVYVAKKGDTLWSAAADFCHDGNRWGFLAKASHISYPYTVMPGQDITVRCS